MSLVQYSSSDDDSDNETSQVIEVSQPQAKQTSIPTILSSATSISSFLPPPKSSTVHKSKGTNLGSGIRNTINDSIAVNPHNIVLPPSKTKITDFIPNSVRSKIENPTNRSSQEQEQHKSDEVSTNPLLGLNLFGEIKTKPKHVIDNTKITIQKFEKPLQDEEEHVVTDNGTTTTVHNSRKRKPADEIPSNIKDFNVSEFYRENITLKEQGLLQENKSLHKVTNQKNQLSALMKNAKQDEELLKERHEHNKKARRERQNQNGW
ncbi:hypothetical protein WICPIJ_007523 [Wickerhamomyces pijperi]|uniref:Uncharacterized protein n=1 Tax=Wickerhamomyces pijperi TaxID=599730 RepID=A0A9P8TK00_WICPI|nr:hypothetical protein WICPIJ_007523 [Wickerhamomyces pijperi]